MRMRPVAATVLVAVGLLAAGCGGSSAPATAERPSAAQRSASPSPTVSPLASLALTAAEASRYGGQPVILAAPAATQVGTGANATLDLCGATFRSEGLRVQRDQVSFATADGQHRIAEINEVVRYRPRGTARAYSELVAVARRCRPMTENGVRLSRLAIERSSPQLVGKQLTVAFSQTHRGSTVYSVNVYQYQGDVFDGIYVTRGSAQGAIDAARSLAAFVARKLRSDASGS